VRAAGPPPQGAPRRTAVTGLALRLAALAALVAACPGSPATEVQPLPTSPCGDGALDADEGCDDGNGVPGDGCDAACRIEPARCGDGADPAAVRFWTCSPGSPCVRHTCPSGDAACAQAPRRNVQVRVSVHGEVLAEQPPAIEVVAEGLDLRCPATPFAADLLDPGPTCHAVAPLCAPLELQVRAPAQWSWRWIGPGWRPLEACPADSAVCHPAAGEHVDLVVVVQRGQALAVSYSGEEQSLRGLALLPDGRLAMTLEAWQKPTFHGGGGPSRLLVGRDGEHLEPSATLGELFVRQMRVGDDGTVWVLGYGAHAWEQGVATLLDRFLLLGLSPDGELRHTTTLSEPGWEVGEAALTPAGEDEVWVAAVFRAADGPGAQSPLTPRLGRVDGSGDLTEVDSELLGCLALHDLQSTDEGLLLICSPPHAPGTPVPLKAGLLGHDGQVLRDLPLPAQPSLPPLRGLYSLRPAPEGSGFVLLGPLAEPALLGLPDGPAGDYLVRLDESWAVQWHHYLGPTEQRRCGDCLRLGLDPRRDEIVVLRGEAPGWAAPGYAVHGLSPAGSLKWLRRHGPTEPGHGWLHPVHLAPGPGGGWVLGGRATGGPGASDASAGRAFWMEL